MERQWLARSCCTTPAAMGFWAAMFVLIYGAGWPFDMVIVWGMVLLGVGVAFIIEWRTAGRSGGSNACAS